MPPVRPPPREEIVRLHDDTTAAFAAPAARRRSAGSTSGDSAGEEVTDTGITTVRPFVAEIARLEDPLCIPSRKRKAWPSEVSSAPEAFILSLIDSKTTMRKILDMSPLSEDDTLRFLAGLIEKGVVRIVKGSGDIRGARAR